MSQHATPAPLIDVSEAAELLGCSERMVRKLVQTRQIQFVRIGRLVRFRRCDIDAYIEARTEAATGSAGNGVSAGLETSEVPQS